MKGNRSKDLPVFRSVYELVAFFETHDMAEYLEKLPEVKFEVRFKKRVSTGTSSTEEGVSLESRNQSSLYKRKK